MLGLIVFIFGLCIGSFLNAAILRLRENKSVIRGRSKCLSCGASLGPLDLIPVVSFFLLHGRCRTCRSPICRQYPIVEFVTGILFLLFYLKFHYGWFGVPFVYSIEGLYFLVRNWILVSFLVVLFVYDLRWMVLPDQFSIPAMLVATMLNLWLGVPALSLVLGAVVLGGFFFIQFAVSKGAWIGGGDIRMGILMGCILGLTQGLVALFFAYLLGALVGLGLLALHRVNRKTPIPFGTFLAIGTIGLLFFGEAPLLWYMSFFV